MSRKKRHAPSVNDVRPFEQTAVLTTLAQRKDAVGETVLKEIERHLASVDPESVAGEVQLDLELIDVDTIEAPSGADRYGYTAPEEAAWKVLEQTLEPYLERMQWYHAAGSDVGRAPRGARRCATNSPPGAPAGSATSPEGTHQRRGWRDRRRRRHHHGPGSTINHMQVSMVKQITITDARDQLSAHVRNAEHGTPFDTPRWTPDHC